MPRLAAVRDAKMKRTADFAAIPGVADALRERRRRGVLRSKITDIEKQIALLEGRVWGRDEQPDAALASRNSGSIKLATQKLEAKKAAFAALPPIAIDVDGMRASFNGATHLQHGGPVARTGAAG
jgi:hypothetical protein